jgi:large subunit ribosomal protein L3
MKKYLLGVKQEMSQYYTEGGHAIPVTVISAGPVTVTQVKDTDKDGYSAIQVGYGTQQKDRINKARLGQMKDMGPFRHLKEFRFKLDTHTANVGDTFDVSQFEVGDKLFISGTSKSKGFQGVVKRHGFHGGPRSHGQKHSEREPGSIGGGGRAGGRVAKGMRMAGRTGGDTITLKNIKIVGVDRDTNTLYVKGAVPGRRGTLLTIYA